MRETPYPVPAALVIARAWEAHEWQALRSTIAALTHFLGLFPKKELAHLIPLLDETPVLPFTRGRWLKHEGFWVPLDDASDPLLSYRVPVELLSQLPGIDGFFVFTPETGRPGILSGYHRPPRADLGIPEHVIVDGRPFQRPFGLEAYRVLIHELAHVHELRTTGSKAEEPALEAEKIFLEYFMTNIHEESARWRALARYRDVLTELGN